MTRPLNYCPVSLLLLCIYTLLPLSFRKSPCPFVTHLSPPVRERNPFLCEFPCNLPRNQQNSNIVKHVLWQFSHGGFSHGRGLRRLKNSPPHFFCILLPPMDMYWHDIFSKTDGKSPQSVSELQGAKEGRRVAIPVFLSAP